MHNIPLGHEQVKFARHETRSPVAYYPLWSTIVLKNFLNAQHIFFVPGVFIAYSLVNFVKASLTTNMYFLLDLIDGKGPKWSM